MYHIIIDFLEKQIVAEGKYQIDKKDNLLEDGIVDSMGMMRLVLYVEEKFNIRIPPEDMSFENFKNVEHIVSYLSKKNV
ncbi:hypothetical protein FGF1_02360 [Flavobacteriaceae bacterium GF1]